MPQPQFNDGVWHHEHANGVIRDINWTTEEVIVFFYNLDDTEAFELQAFERFHPKFKQWMLYA